MSRSLQGIGASPGRVLGEVRQIRWDIPRVAHRTIDPDDVEGEIARFEEALARALERTEELRDRTAQRLGDVEAKIFDPQSLMLQDPDLVEGTLAYIRDNFLAAERAFDWRVLELRSRFADTAHAMVTDRLADLRDIRVRVLSRLLDDDTLRRPEESAPEGGSTVLAFRELTPAFAMSLEPEHVAGLLVATGSRASHAAVLSRSLHIPAVVGLGEALEEITAGSRVMLDGATGRVVVDPTEEDVEAYRRLQVHSRERRERLAELAEEAPTTRDGVHVTLQANLDQPDEVEEATRVAPEGVGLFRSEFLVIGRRTIPTEEQQYEAYRRVVEAFPEHQVTLRTFDIGGDKFPMFLSMPPEENPYLGWRAIRVCLDRPELFRNQLRAAVRAGRFGHLRLLLPFVTSVEEIRRTRQLLREVTDDVNAGASGDEVSDDVPLGVMVETPAAVELLDLLASHVDFLSLGTNDLTQYVLAVDRGNPRLTNRYEPLHPALFRLYRRVRATATEHDLDLSVCGDLATDPVGFAALLGLGYRQFSVSPRGFPVLKEWIRSVDTRELAEICDSLEGVESAGEIRAPLEVYLEAALPGDRIATDRLTPQA